jgi:hypothetical protein
MARTYKTATYTDDQGGQWNVKVDSATIAQVTGSPSGPVIGGGVATEVHPNLRHALKPRVALCQEPTGGKVHRVICLSNTAPLYVTIGTTISLYDLDGGSAITCTMYSAEGEKHRSKKLT